MIVASVDLCCLKELIENKLGLTVNWRRKFFIFLLSIHPDYFPLLNCSTYKFLADIYVYGISFFPNYK